MYKPPCHSNDAKVNDERVCLCRTLIPAREKVTVRKSRLHGASWGSEEVLAAEPADSSGCDRPWSSVRGVSPSHWTSPHDSDKVCVSVSVRARVVDSAHCL